MSFEIMRGEIDEEWSRLCRVWNAACDEWRDSVRDEFERNYWRYIESALPPYLDDLDELIRTVSDARRNVT